MADITERFWDDLDSMVECKKFNEIKNGQKNGEKEKEKKGKKYGGLIFACENQNK